MRKIEGVVRIILEDKKILPIIREELPLQIKPSAEKKTTKPYLRKRLAKLTIRIWKKLEDFQTWGLRRMNNITWKDRRRNEEVLRL